MSDPQIRSESKVVRPVEDAQVPILRRQLVAHTYGVTHRGQVRDQNEDQFLIARLIKALEIQHTSLPQPKKRNSSDHSYLMIVADGMGGAQGGEEASALAIESVETYILETIKWFAHCRENDEDHVLAEFRTALAQAHGRVLSESAQHPDLRGMGTTLTLAYSINDELFLAHVGDSRGYLFRGNALYRLTQDHTLVEEMVRRGALKPEQAATHKWRHVITSTVGGESDEVRVDVHRLHLEPGDLVLLCSDGLTEMLTVDQIAEVLAAQHDPQRACERLVTLANDSGGRDNITVAMARYESLTEADTEILEAKPGA